MTLDFTAIDFETANSYRGSPCSVGLVKVRDGQIVDESFTLIHPPARFDHFDGFNTWLHHINADMVAGAPSWQKVADWIVRYTESDTLVCHNAGFDIGVIRYACIADGIPWPSVDFLCTLVLARRAYAQALGQPEGGGENKAQDDGRPGCANWEARAGGRYALVTMCIGGGQGIAAVFERA